MNTLQKHEEEKQQHHNGWATKFDGYIQMGHLYDSGHNELGCTYKSFEKYVSYLKHPNYAYARSTQYGINVYAKDNDSPTGVKQIGSIPKELNFLLYAFSKTGELSPTEDKRSAH